MWLKSKWSFADKFFTFLIAIGFLSFAKANLSLPQDEEKHTLMDSNRADATDETELKKRFSLPSRDTKKRGGAYQDKL